MDGKLARAAGGTMAPEERQISSGNHGTRRLIFERVNPSLMRPENAHLRHVATTSEDVKRIKGAKLRQTEKASKRAAAAAKALENYHPKLDEAGLAPPAWALDVLPS